MFIILLFVWWRRRLKLTLRSAQSGLRMSAYWRPAQHKACYLQPVIRRESGDIERGKRWLQSPQAETPGRRSAISVHLASLGSTALIWPIYNYDNMHILYALLRNVKVLIRVYVWERRVVYGLKAASTKDGERLQNLCHIYFFQIYSFFYYQMDVATKNKNWEIIHSCVRENYITICQPLWCQPQKTCDEFLNRFVVVWKL